MKYQNAMELPAAVSPRLSPVTLEEISAMNAEIDFPTDLVECWLQIGCGFFSKNEAGERLTKFQNRLVGPDEILEMRDGDAFPEDSPFSVGMPFFETADMRFLVLAHDGSIVHQSGTHISDSLAMFLHDIVRDPEFWLAKLRT